MTASEILDFFKENGPKLLDLVSRAKEGEVQHVHVKGLVMTIQTEDSFQDMMAMLNLVAEASRQLVKERG